MALGKGSGNDDARLGRRRHRDERQSPVSTTLRPANRKKNTARWCKGKLGVEHDFSAYRPWGFSQIGAWKVCCSQCGKMTGRALWSKPEVVK